MTPHHHKKPIMRLSVAFQSALAIGALSVSHGFVRPTTLYKVQSQARADQIERLRAEVDEEDESPGGSRFKELLEKAQQAEPNPAGGPILYNPMVGISPPTPPSMDSLSVEEQARMFREMVQNQQQQQPMMPAPAPQRRTEPRKQGRNRDADTISNTADLYFAQLKRDSTVRTIARYTGDVDKANAVFQDPGVEELNHLIKTNPYLKDTGMQQGLLDTSAEEMIAVMKLTAGSGDGPQTDYVPPSYKQKLMDKRKNKLVGTVPDQPQVSAPIQETLAVVESQAQTPPVVTQPTPTPPVQQPQPVVLETAPKVHSTPVRALESTPAADEDAASGVTRRTIRTLMGMILKHRGGPGFGSGRLKGAEAEHFESLLGEVTEMFRSEAFAAHSTRGTAATELKVQSVAFPQPQRLVTPPAQVAPAATVVSPSSYATTAAGPAPVDDRISRTMACVEGAVQMYKNSPPEIQEGLLLPLRAALMSAVNTCNQVIAEEEVDNGKNYREAVPPQPVETIAGPASVDDRISRTMACVEGAVQMYKNSPIEIQEGLLLPLRAALMSAVNTCNQVIAEKEVENVKNYREAVPPHPAESPQPLTPPQFFEVTPYTPFEALGEEATLAPEPVSESPAVQIHSGTDEHTEFLQRIYDKLVVSSGDEKFGLGKLSSAEAAALADQVVEMKATLIEELETGIPKAVVTSPASSSSTDTGSSYQKMLTKAKAAKAANSA